jgi:hypothetical protein
VSPAPTGPKRWTTQVKLDPDVEKGALTEAMFAIDLGAIWAGDSSAPVIYRDAEKFFRATHLTSDLRKLLEEVLASLGGQAGYNRVLKLRTPFGGGKSHTLASLLHAARDRKALDVIPSASSLPNPGPVAVAVFDGEKFDARDGRVGSDGQAIRTMWGWLAWQISPTAAFPLVAGHDADRVAPGGDVIKQLLTTGAEGRPVLLLLDEVLKYMERSAAVAVLDSTLQRQALDFFQNLTVEVAGASNAALVYSLTWSAREALGNVALLTEIDKLAARVDQLREPVTGDEILPVLQRRLLGDQPNPAVAGEVAEAFEHLVTNMRRAYADTPAEKHRVDEEGLVFRDRLRAAYPFHPALIDLMRERWSSVEAFQRTRGALRFLASCLHAIKARGGAGLLLGPGNLPLQDADVRLQMLKELGVQNEYDAVIAADIAGPNARAARIDQRLAEETPALSEVRPATRLATAILAYSFGGLRRESGAQDEPLPAGIGENELLAACVAPDFEHQTARAVLADLRNSCLYLHYDGIRYCFKKEPNVTKLIEDAADEISREETHSAQGPVREKIRQLLDQKLAGRPAEVWPAKSQDIPDEDPRFLVAYLPLEFAQLAPAEQSSRAKELLEKYGDRPRKYRNGIGVAIPDKQQLEPLRRAVRYQLAVGRVEEKRQQHRLTKDQLDQLRERGRTETAATESSLRDLYSAVWLPRAEAGEIDIERIEKGGKPLVATGVHERVMELLTTQGVPRLFATVKANKIVEKLRLGEAVSANEPPRMGARMSEVRDAFYSFMEPPRLESANALKSAVAEGIENGTLVYTFGPVPEQQQDGTYKVSPERVVKSRIVSPDEIDFDTGFIMLPSAVPAPAPAPDQPGPEQGYTPTGEQTPDTSVAETKTVTSSAPAAPTNVQRSFRATRSQVFKAFPAIANLADKSDDGKITIVVKGASSTGYDPGWLRNAFDEPLEEADVEVTDS